MVRQYFKKVMTTSTCSNSVEFPMVIPTNVRKHVLLNSSRITIIPGWLEEDLLKKLFGRRPQFVENCFEFPWVIPTIVIKHILLNSSWITTFPGWLKEDLYKQIFGRQPQYYSRLVGRRPLKKIIWKTASIF